METPGPVALGGDELHRATGHVGRLGILVPDPGRKARMAHRPAGQEVSVGPCGGIGEVVPGIIRLVSALPQIVAVFRVDAFAEKARIDAVVAIERLEAALGQKLAAVGTRINAEPLHAG